MNVMSELTILCMTSYEKGQEFMRECKRQGWRVLLLTDEKLQNAHWPRECLDEVYLMPDLTIRAEVPSEGGDKSVSRYEQALMIPQFLDLEKLTASHRHGMLRLTLPLKERVKPRRVQIETQVEDQKQLVGVR